MISFREFRVFSVEILNAVFFDWALYFLRYSVPDTCRINTQNTNPTTGFARFYTIAFYYLSSNVV